MNTFNSMVKFLCDRSGKTTKDLAQEIGMPNSTLSDWQAGTSPRVGDESVDKFAKFFKVTIDYLRTGVDKTGVVQQEIQEMLLLQKLGYLDRMVAKEELIEKQGSLFEDLGIETDAEKLRQERWNTKRQLERIRAIGKQNKDENISDKLLA